jgi:DNA-binding CsgD family transcriptional regulator
VLLGRQTERARVERLLNDARQGRSGLLVLRGEAGIGKTTLLRYAEDLAEAMTVVSATGIETEAELEYSSLLELVRPLLSRLDEIPINQADALREALGLAPPSRRDRFAVGAALLSLLAASAEAHPLLVVVDDAQWVDRASLEAIGFAAHRLRADRAAFLVATRDDAGTLAAKRADAVDLVGLDEGDVATLFERLGAAGLDIATVERLRVATGGNPLALSELTGLLTPAQMSAWRADEEPLPVGGDLREAFARRAESLPPRTREALVVAATASNRDVEVIARALRGLGLDLAALVSAEDAGLIELSEGSVMFRHPLVRAAIHQAAPPSERRNAHAALADALAGSDDERRAWHLAAAALGPDESIAAALEDVASRSSSRGGHTAAAQALAQAARLSGDDGARLDRLVRAAQSSWSSGTPEVSIAILDEALGLSVDARGRSRALALRGRIEGDVGQQSAARDMLLEAAALVEEDDPLEAASDLLAATTPLYFGGDVAGSLATAERARALVPRDGSPLDVRADVVLGWALSHAGRNEEAETTLVPALERILATDPLTQPALQNARLALDILERPREVRELAPMVDSLARADGPLALVNALEQDTRFLVRSGEWDRAVASGEETLGIAGALGHEVDVSRVHVLLGTVDAARGDESQCSARLEHVARAARLHGLETLSATADVVQGLLELGLGRLADAASTLERVARRSEQLGLFARDVVPEPDLVEALVALGRHEDARRWLDAFHERASRASPRWGAALVARGRGILNPGEFDSDFAEALDLHRVVPDRFQEGRTLLAFGERLRRATRKRDARTPLREALVVFEELEAAPWIMRTRRELRATGEKLGRRVAASGDDLTPQELQVALQVASGKTNKDVGAALFLSPKTVEFHLARVYRKLDISSRAALIRRYAEAGDAVLEPVG